MPNPHPHTALGLLLLAAMLLTGLTACTPPHRFARDGTTLIPLKGPEGNLPEDGTVPKGDGGPIYFDSLYARMKTHIVAPYPVYIEYMRFWPTGQTLRRAKPGPALGEQAKEPIVLASDGNVLGDWLAGPPLGFAESDGIVGYYCIVGEDIYIEMFARDMEGPSFRLLAGKLTEDGFVLNRYKPGKGLIRQWKLIPEERFVRYRVGQMRGEPSW